MRYVRNLYKICSKCPISWNWDFDNTSDYMSQHLSLCYVGTTFFLPKSLGIFLQEYCILTEIHITALAGTILGEIRVATLFINSHRWTQ